MEDYSDLLREAIDIIRGKKEEVSLASLVLSGWNDFTDRVAEQPRGR